MNNRPNSSSSETPRYTIGLLLDNIYESYGIKLWSGVVSGVQAETANLICFVGGSLDSPYYYHSQRNVLYDLINVHNIDGLITNSGSLGNYVGSDALIGFYSRFSPIPIVSAGVPIENIPSVYVDNEKGMRDILSHLIDFHGFKRIAFIRGPECNPEAELRFRVYKEALESHGIDFDPLLVAPGDFDRNAGKTAVEILIDERKLRFDALVGANDYMAIYAMKALKVRGIRVPEEVAVAGFDDIKESYGVIPSLTTVRQPLLELGIKAVNLMLKLLDGEKSMQNIKLDTKMIVRRSCGCISREKELYSFSAATKAQDSRAMRNDSINKKIIGKLELSMSVNFSDSKSKIDTLIWSTNLVESLSQSFKTGSDSGFLLVFEDVIMESVATGIDLLAWFPVTSVLFTNILEYSEEEREFNWYDKLWKESLVLIGETAERVQAFFRANTEEQAVILNKINQELITHFDLKKLKRVLVTELPMLGIKGAYISLYVKTKPARAYSRLLLGYDPPGEHSDNGKKNLVHETTEFESRDLIPGSTRKITRAYSFVVMALHFKSEQLGFALFEMGPISGTVYETLASQISSALKGARLEYRRKHLEKEITEISRKEQIRIGQDLHDGICQSLTGIAFMCKVLRDQLRQRGIPESEEAEEILSLINESISSTRNLARGLFPVELEESGLTLALQDLIARFEHQSKVSCHFNAIGEITIRDNAIASNLYRITQEAVTNALKHGQPDNVYVEIREKSGKIFLSVRDDGVGFPENTKAKGLGLMTMKYRAKIINARLAIRRVPGGGTLVACYLRNRSGEEKECNL